MFKTKNIPNKLWLLSKLIEIRRNTAVSEDVEDALLTLIVRVATVDQAEAWFMKPVVSSLSRDTGICNSNETIILVIYYVFITSFTLLYARREFSNYAYLWITRCHLYNVSVVCIFKNPMRMHPRFKIRNYNYLSWK